MAIEDGHDFTQRRTSPKAFTEYTFNAMLVFVGMIGSCVTVIGAAVFYFTLLPLDPLFFGRNYLSGYIGLAMVPIGLAQIYYSWKMHKENFSSFQGIIIISWILIILSFVSAFFMGLLLIFTINLVVGQIFTNILVIFFLSKIEVQQEFMWETGGY
ncbi:MAG: hypothetical protein ACW96M_07710 [Candidatus Thorarchaeota archaeon]